MTIRFGRHRCQPWARAFVALCALTACRATFVAQVQAQESADAKASSKTPSKTSTLTAEAHSDTGARLMNEGRFDEAISEFRQAYELEARPAFLFHIGRGYERLGQENTALHFFRRFLATQPPESPERTEAELAVASAPPPTLPRAREPVLMPSAELYDANDAEETRLVSRWWFWAGLGAVTLAAAAFGVAIWSAGDDNIPASDLGHKRLN